MDRVTGESARVRGVSEPDPAAWVDRHGDALYAYAYVRVRDRTIAEDLVQDTLLAGIRAAGDFRGESAERTWLVGILRHKLLDHYRAAARDVKFRDDGAFDDTNADFDERGQWHEQPERWDSPELAFELDEFWGTFNDCLDDLPEKMRAPFVMRELDGLETDRLTETLSITKNHLWVLLSRARQQLRKCLSRRWFSA